MRRSLIIGGKPVTVDAPDDASFLALLREPLGRKSVVRGCANRECGACRVMVNGRLAASCGLALRDVPDGATILTREDVQHEPAVDATIQAFEVERPTRCRLCVGGLAVTAHHVSRGGAELEDVLAHATCMCTGRGSLRRALRTALVRRS